MGHLRGIHSDVIGEAGLEQNALALGGWRDTWAGQV